MININAMGKIFADLPIKSINTAVKGCTVEKKKIVDLIDADLLHKPPETISPKHTSTMNEAYWTIVSEWSS